MDDSPKKSDYNGASVGRPSRENDGYNSSRRWIFILRSRECVNLQLRKLLAAALLWAPSPRWDPGDDQATQRYRTTTITSSLAYRDCNQVTVAFNFGVQPTMNQLNCVVLNTV